ncbi:MAG TPA: hypothetical protein VF530_19705 [Planctomycetota bacterium]
MSHLRCPLARLLLLLPLGVACQSSAPLPTPATEQPRARLSNVFTASAEVTAIAAAERRLTLRREDGRQLELTAGEAVRNFDQIAVGDHLRVRFEETLAAAKLPPGEDIRSGEAAFAAGRARPGAKPAAGLGAALAVRVRIESIDREHDIVVFALASGELIAHRLQTPEGRAFVTQLAVGDGVQLEYGEALVLGIEKP